MRNFSGFACESWKKNYSKRKIKINLFQGCRPGVGCTKPG